MKHLSHSRRAAALVVVGLLLAGSREAGAQSSSPQGRGIPFSCIYSSVALAGSIISLPFSAATGVGAAWTIWNLWVGIPGAAYSVGQTCRR